MDTSSVRKVLTKLQAKNLIESMGGKIFTVSFIKRTTGEVRLMNCRMGVSKHVKGGPRAYDPSAHNLIWVYDLQRAGYRSIALEGLQTVTADGCVYEVKDE